jgi:hypothetical protein
VISHVAGSTTDAGAAQSAQPALRFAQIGDSHIRFTRPEHRSPQTFAEAIGQINNLGYLPDFVMLPVSSTHLAKARAGRPGQPDVEGCQDTPCLCGTRRARLDVAGHDFDYTSGAAAHLPGTRRGQTGWPGWVSSTATGEKARRYAVGVVPTTERNRARKLVDDPNPHCDATLLMLRSVVSRSRLA